MSSPAAADQEKPVQVTGWPGSIYETLMLALNASGHVVSDAAQDALERVAFMIEDDE